MILGDAIDRGFFSLDVLLLILQLMQTNPDGVTYIRGNHETLLLSQQLKLEVSARVQAKTIEGEKQSEKKKRDQTASDQLFSSIQEFFSYLPSGCLLDLPKKVGTTRIWLAHGAFSPKQKQEQQQK